MDYHVSDTYNDCLGSLFLVTEIHRQGILQHSYNIFGSFEQQSNKVISWSAEFTYVNPQVYKTKASFVDSVFIDD